MSPTKLPDEGQEQKKVERLSPLYQQILKNIAIMPDTAAIPVPVAALHEGVSRRTIKRTYQPKSPARAIDYIDGDLVELGKPAVMPTESERRMFYAELRGYQQTARKRDGTPYANGWAANQYRTKYGSYPPWSWNNDAPAIPSPPTLRWIKSRIIAWAKARSAA